MTSGTAGLMFARFDDAADAVARARPGVDLEIARELLREAATMLDNSLVLDDLDEHDAAIVIDALSSDLVATDPGAAVRARAALTRSEPGALHDPEVAVATLLGVVSVLRL